MCMCVCVRVCSARNKDQKLVGRFFKKWIFYRLLLCCPVENVWEIWPIKIDFGRPNAEIGRKMASGQLLFLALVCPPPRPLIISGVIWASCDWLNNFQFRFMALFVDIMHGRGPSKEMCHQL